MVCLYDGIFSYLIKFQRAWVIRVMTSSAKAWGDERVLRGPIFGGDGSCGVVCGTMAGIVTMGGGIPTM